MADDFKKHSRLGTLFGKYGLESLIEPSKIKKTEKKEEDTSSVKNLLERFKDLMNEDV